MDGNFLTALLQTLAGQPSTVPPVPHVPLTAENLGIANPVAPTPVSNILQTAAPADTPQQAPSQPAKVATAVPRERHSLLDTIGRVADAFSVLGDAGPGYQSTLDAQEARKRAAITEGQHDTLAEQQIGAGADEATTRHNTLVGTAVRALQAIRRHNPQADINTVWPLLAQQAGIPADQTQRLGQIFAAHPDAVDGIASITAGHQEYNGQVIYARGPDGHIAAFQPSNSNASDARNILPAGFEPIDPLTFVNTGNAQVGVGRNSAVPRVILPVTERPGSAEDRASRERIAREGNATTITVAGMPARAQAGQNSHAGDPTNGLTLLNNIENAFGQLHRMNALPGDDGGVVGNVVGALGRTHLGQAIGEQAGSPAAQTRLEIAKNVSALQQEMLRSLPASATRTRFEQEMLARGLPDPTRMSYSTARTVIRQLRDSYTRALAVANRQAASAGAARPRPAATVQPRAGGDDLPTFTPAQAAAAPPRTRFRSTDGRILVRR